MVRRKECKKFINNFEPDPVTQGLRKEIFRLEEELMKAKQVSKMMSDAYKKLRRKTKEEYTNEVIEKLQKEIGSLRSNRDYYKNMQKMPKYMPVFANKRVQL